MTEKAVDPKNHIDEIYSAVENDILFWELKPGEQISENSLCQRFQVSRTPAREVLQRLHINGYVKIESRKATTVSLLDYEQIAQMIYQRVAVETFILEDFINIANGFDIERMKYFFQKMEEIKQSMGKNPSDAQIELFYQYDSAFHKLMFQTTNKLFLWHQLQHGNSHYNRFKMMDMKLNENFNDVTEEHGAILQAVIQKDTSALKQIVATHLNGGVRRMGAELFTTYKAYFESEVAQ